MSELSSRSNSLTPLPTSKSNITSTSSTSSGRSRSLAPTLATFLTQLHQQTDRVLSGKELTISQQRLYKTVEWLCQSKFQSSLTKELYLRIDGYLDSLVQTYISQFDLRDSKAKLSNFIEVYNQLNHRCAVLQRVYLYLDRTYLLNHPVKRTVDIYWKEKLYSSLCESELDQRLLKAFVDVLNDVRNNEFEHGEELIHVFQKLSQVYDDVTRRNEMQDFVIEGSKRYYSKKHDQLMSSIGKDLIYGNMASFITSELNLWSLCKNTNLSKELRHQCIKIMLFRNLSSDFPVYVTALFQTKKFLDLHNLFQLIVNQTLPEVITEFKEVWTNYIKTYLTFIIETYSVDLDLITKAFTAKSHLNTIVATHFKSDEQMEFALRSAFLDTLSIPSHSSQINKNLVKYIDRFFKKLELAKLDQNERTLQDISDLFKSIQNKEQFLLDYQLILSRRLIQQTTKSIPMEAKLIDLFMKQYQGPLVFSLGNMVRDIVESKSHFKNDTTVKFDQLTLKDEWWPKTGRRGDLLSILQSQDIGEDFKQLYDLRSTYQFHYNNNHTNNKEKILRYDTTKGNMTLSYQFTSDSKNFQIMNENIALVLLLFNTHQSLTSEEIVNITKLEKREVLSILYTLTETKTNILLKGQTSNAYSINENFTSSKSTIVIRLTQLSPVSKSSSLIDSTITSSSSSPSSSFDDPALAEYIRAFIVRNLKHSKFLSHGDLIGMILKRYDRCTNVFIKKQIEYLIDMAYVKREKEGYSYVP